MSTPKFNIFNYKQLVLDDKNPRLPRSMQEKSEEDIIKFMLLDATTLELMQAIGQNDFFVGEQLLVIKEETDKYRVIEGNRRLVAVKLLNEPELATVQQSKVKRVYEEAFYRPKEIPCLVFDDKEKILKYLGYRHITGIKSWKLLEKARYLHTLRSDIFPDEPFYQSCRNLAKMIGSRRDYVQRVVAGYEIYKLIEEAAFYNIPYLNDRTFHFNYIADSLSRAKITAFLGVNFENPNPISNINLNHLKQWTHWFFEKNSQNKTRLIGDSSHLNKLNKIMENEKAFQAFTEGQSIEDAFELTKNIDNFFSNSLNKSLEYLEQANNLIYKVNEPETSIDTLKNISKLTRIILTSIQNNNDEF